MRIDAHHHFWTRSHGFYEWLTPDLVALNHDFKPTDLAPALTACQVEATVLVQAAPYAQETDILLAQAAQTNFVKAVVGWADMESPAFAQEIERLRAHPLFKGVRPMVQDIEDANWLIKPILTPAFECLSEKGLVFEALVRPPQWQALLECVKSHPTLSIVLDHAAKPAINNGLNGDGGFSDWAPMIDQLAANKHVSCKLSGLLTEALPGAGLGDIKPYLDHLYASFGPDRLMWGSDWPVLNMNGEYTAWIDMMESWLDDKPADARTKIWATNAARQYDIAVSPNNQHSKNQSSEVPSW